MGKEEQHEKFHPFKMLKQFRKPPKVLGWQYEMIYLGGDSLNPEQAIVHVRALEKAIVIRAADGKEETFQSLLIPYISVLNVTLEDTENKKTVSIGEKGSIGDVFETVYLQYNDSGKICSLKLRMSMAADIYQNAKLCKNFQEYVAARLKS